MICPPGSAAQSRSLVVLAVLIGVIGGVLIGFCVFTRYNKRKQLEAESVGIISNEIRQYLTKGGDEDEFPPSREASATKRSVVKSTRTIETSISSTNDDNLRQPIMNQEADTNETNVISIPTSRFQTPTIRFDNMGLRLEVGEAKGKLVLDNVTGVIPPGSFVAVMGPSGSGKSTFMHTLAGKAFYGTRLGHVYVNGDEVDLNQFSKIVGFVKQDDIMLREMTVAETLLFNARMRYDPLSIDSPEGIANAMLTALDLNHVRNINIGDEKKRGISGGQRKRVNIGMELVALPSILFLDEPTSGLDSSSSMCVCSALRDMASVGITVIAVIHQPRYEIFNMFHRVLLLAKGGKLVYYGAPQDALRYFEDYIGIKCPPHVNPPDFFMDVISGEVNELGLSIDDMVQKWNDFVASSPTNQPTSPTNPPQVDPYEQQASRPPRYNSVMHLSDGTDHIVSGAILASQAQKKEIAGFFAQLWHFTTRSFVQLSRDVIWFFTDLMLVFVAGFFLGLVFSESTYQPPLPQQIVNRSLSGFGSTPPPLLSEFFARPVDDPIISEASLTCMAIGMTGVTAALRVFGNEQIVYWREASAGMSTSAYFLAKNISHIFFILLSPLLYLAPFLTFVSARASFLAYYRVIVVLQFATTGLGYLVSIVVPGGLAQLAGVVVVLVFSMFGGSRPTLVQIKSMFVLLQVMPYASYIRWAQEALYLEEIREWGEVVNIQPSLNLFDYHLDDYELCMILTLVFGVVFRCLALIAMVALHRDQKH